MARHVSDYRVRIITERGNEEDGPNSRARGDRFYRNRRSADRGNEKVNRDPGIIYDYPPVHDEYEDEVWYYWMTGSEITYDPTGYIGVREDEVVQLFYYFVESEGNPDIFDRIFHIIRGGISKSSKIINLEEDKVNEIEKTIIHNEEEANSWKRFIDSKVHLRSSRALEPVALVYLNGKLCIIRNNMSLSLVDISSPNKETAMKTEFDAFFKFDGQIRGVDYVFDPGGWFLKLSKLEDEFFRRGGE